MRFFFTLGVLLTLTFSPACTEPQEDFQKFDAKLKELDQNLRKLSKEIQKVIGEKKCKSDLDCQVLELGQKVCDYHTHYEIYSIRGTNLKKLYELTEAFNRNDEELNKLSYKVKHCGTAPPGARCFKKSCVKVAR